MILQALESYYRRLLKDEESDVAPPGFSKAGISFGLIIDGQGKIVDVHDLRDQRGDKYRPRRLLVPQEIVRSGSGFDANFLWDKTDYALGAVRIDRSDEKKQKESQKKAARALKAFAAFQELAHQIGDRIEDPGVKAVLAFVDSWSPENADDLPLWEEMSGQNVAFRLDGRPGFVHESEAVKQVWLDYWTQKEAGKEGQCLVSGRRGPISRLHPAIKGVWGAQSSGARLVSFNLDAFTSFGKEQNYNSPVGNQAAFAYTTALNKLLAQSSGQRIQIGDASVVFWSEDASPLEEIMGMVINGAPAEDQALNQRINAFLNAAKLGLPSPELKADNPFYILGLSPNASRLAVRFWFPSTEGEIKDRLGEHLTDLEIIRQSERQPEHPPAWMLLAETAVQGKRENIPPLLSGELTRAILSGEPYPQSLLAAVISRIRADKNVSYIRAALLKACLNRRQRKGRTAFPNPQRMEVTVSLDENCTIPAYRLGRLFAVLENLQRAALGQNINATIRDKYLSSASAAPRSNFPTLLRNSHNHYAKLRKDKGGLAVFFDKAIRDIVDGLEVETGLPTTLDMEQQGLFFLGYYHQKAYRSEKADQNAEAAAAAAETPED
jgi:CRISPR-associated protein Csd1